MAIFPGFIGGAYLSQSVNVDAQRCVNWYPEVVESQRGKNVAVLYPTPGKSQFCDIGEGPVRVLFRANTRCFAIGGTKFVEILSDGTVVPRGDVVSDDLAATISSNGQQLFVTSGRQGYIYKFADDTFAVVDDPDFLGSSCGAYADGYFVSLDLDSQEFRISALYDGNQWDTLDFAEAEADPDDTLALLTDHRLLWLFGRQTVQVFYNSGNADFPWTPIPEGLLEVGISAAASAVKLDNSPFWLGGSDRGGRMVWRAIGYTPQRISTHAIETALASYPTVENAVGFGYEENGHSFYVLNFPGITTWVYDVASGLWHERGYWDQANGQFTEDRARCHTYVFDKHLVGDRENGKVYELSNSVYTDAGDTIRRLRSCPHLSAEELWTFYNELQIDLEAGVGLVTGQGSAPVLVLQWSDDGGHVWSNERQVGMGALGQYKFRAMARRLGRSRDRVFRIVLTDPVNASLIGAYLSTAPGNR